MKGNKKIKDSFENIAVEIRAGGLNVKQWAKTKGFPLTTVRYALYGYPQTERSAMIRAEARAAVRRLQDRQAEVLKELSARAEKLFSK